MSLLEEHTVARDADVHPDLAYELGDTKETTGVYRVKELIQCSSWLPHRVRLVCGERKAELLGGHNLNLESICVRCQCIQCMERAKTCKDKGSVRGDTWGRIMLLESFFEHGMNVTLQTEDEGIIKELVLSHVMAISVEPRGNHGHPPEVPSQTLGEWLREQGAKWDYLVGRSVHVYWYEGDLGHRWFKSKVVSREEGLKNIPHGEDEQGDGRLFIKYAPTASEPNGSYSIVHPNVNFLHWGHLAATIKYQKTGLAEDFKPRPPPPMDQDDGQEQEPPNGDGSVDAGGREQREKSEVKKRKTGGKGNAEAPLVRKVKVKHPVISPEVIQQAAAAAAAAVGVKVPKKDRKAEAKSKLGLGGSPSAASMGRGTSNIFGSMVGSEEKAQRAANLLLKMRQDNGAGLDPNMDRLDTENIPRGLSVNEPLSDAAKNGAGGSVIVKNSVVHQQSADPAFVHPREVLPMQPLVQNSQALPPEIHTLPSQSRSVAQAMMAQGTLAGDQEDDPIVLGEDDLDDIDALGKFKDPAAPEEDTEFDKKEKNFQSLLQSCRALEPDPDSTSPLTSESSHDIWTTLQVVFLSNSNLDYLNLPPSFPNGIASTFAALLDCFNAPEEAVKGVRKAMMTMSPIEAAVAWRELKAAVDQKCLDWVVRILDQVSGGMWCQAYAAAQQGRG